MRPNIAFDLTNKTVWHGGKSVILTPSQIAIFCTIWKSQRPIGPQRLYNLFYSLRLDCDKPTIRTTVTMVSVIRRKIEAIGLSVTNGHSGGYRIVLKAEDEERIAA